MKLKTKQLFRKGLKNREIYQHVICLNLFPVPLKNISGVNLFSHCDGKSND